MTILGDSIERRELDVGDVDPGRGCEHLRDLNDAGHRSLPQEAQGLLDNLPAHRTLFYPLADLDLEPLHRVGHLAIDVLFLCDWRWPCSPDGCDATISELLDEDSASDGLELFSQVAGQRSFELPAEQVMAITGVSADFRLFDEPSWTSGNQPWGRIIPLRRRSGDVEHPIWVVHLVGNAVEVYQNLFLERGAAPKILWLDPPLGADLDGWAEFISPGGEFGRVFTTAAHQPDYVVAQRYQPGWQQTVLCQRLPGWHSAWSLRVYGLPGAPAI